MAPAHDRRDRGPRAGGGASPDDPPAVRVPGLRGVRLRGLRAARAEGGGGGDFVKRKDWRRTCHDAPRLDDRLIALLGIAAALALGLMWVVRA